MLEKIFLGVSLAAPVGPVTIEMIRRGLRGGFFAAFAIRLGGAIGNTLCLIGAYLGLSYIDSNSTTMSFIGLGGACLLVYMGIQTIRKALQPVNLDHNSATAHENKNALWLGFFLAIANPLAIAFWVGVFANSIQDANAAGIDNPGLLVGLGHNLPIIAGVLLWGAALSAVIAFGRQYIGPRIIRAITFGAGVALLFYGVNYMVKNL